jgi:Gpi18-like mannosyltransferase
LHLFSDEAKALTAFKIWILNPFVIVVSYVYGQYDIFSVFFMILTLYFLKRKRFSWAMLAIGVGGCFKIVTLALLPLVAISFWKTMDKENLRIKLFKISLVTVLGLLPLLSIPFILLNVPQYYESVNFAQPVGSWFNGFFGETFYTRGTVGQPFYSGLLSFLLDFSVTIRTQTLIQDFIYFIPIVYTIVLLGAVYEPQLPFEKTCKYFTVFLLAYYAFSLFHVQWFLWIQPFLILLIVENRTVFGKLFVLLIPFYFTYSFLWDANLTAILLTPIIPKALYWPGPIILMNNAGLPALQIISLFRTLFSAICVFMIFYIVKNSFWISERRENEF